MKQILPYLLIVLILSCFSCKKHDNPSSSNNPTDTLAAGWTKIAIDQSDFYDIFFINSTGFVISNAGIYKSINSGTNWTKITPSGTNLANMGMGSEMNAIFVLEPNKLVSTHNSGGNFDTITVADNLLTDVFFVSPTVAYAAGKGIWKTTDAGYNWVKLYDFTVQDGFKVLYFLNEQTGWVMRPDGLYKTSNGGSAWLPVNAGAIYNSTVTANVFFINVNHGLIAGERLVGATLNGGTSWNTIYSGNSVFHDIHFISDNVGYITDNTRILKTIDGGASWTKEVGLVANAIIEMHFIDANHGWACGLGGTMLKYER